LGDKTKILIVDDEPMNLEFFEVMLSKLGFEVEMAQDGEEALEKVLGFRPDVVVLDNIMPKLTGWEVTKIIKSDEEYEEVKNTPIIMFSAMDDVKDKVEGFELGIEDYITKPFNFSEVLARIRAVLRHRELAKQVLKKERHITKVESLSQSLLYFTEHLKEPVEGLLTKAQDLDTSEPQKIEMFVKHVIGECDQVLATLAGLKDEIQELKQNIDQKPVKSEKILEDLEEKFQKQFVQMKETEQLR
jgi:DNA-binding response OmpR family regulator